MSTPTVEQQESRNATTELVEWALQASYADFPEETTEFTKALLLKTVTSMVVGACEPFGRLMIRHSLRGGGTPEAGVVGGGHKTSVENAAYANGTIAHTPEMEDCFFRPENRESSSPVWIFPALLTLGETRLSTGREIVEAAVVAFEVSSRLVAGSPGLGVLHGINTSTWWGVPAVAAGASRMLGLDATATSNAMSIALSQASGLGHQTGYDAHKLEAGHSCRAGIMAALLAADGATGAPDFVDDEYLAFCVVRPDGTADIPATVRDLGRPPYAVHFVEFKKYPGCGLLHASIDALSLIMSEHGLRADDIDYVETVVNPLTAEYCDRRFPATLDSARWSLSYTLAEVMLAGRISQRTFSDERALVDPRHCDAQSQVRVVVDPNLSIGHSGARVTVGLHDGTVHEQRLASFWGHPDQPIAPPDVVQVLTPYLDEFMSVAQRDQVIELVMNMDRRPDIVDLMHLLTNFRHQR